MLASSKVPSRKCSSSPTDPGSLLKEAKFPQKLQSNLKPHTEQHYMRACEACLASKLDTALRSHSAPQAGLRDPCYSHADAP